MLALQEGSAPFGRGRRERHTLDDLDTLHTNKTNILDDLEAEEEEEDGAKPAPKADGEAKPPPYGPGGNPQDPSRGPPPPYPGQQKVRLELAWVWQIRGCLKFDTCCIWKIKCLMQHYGLHI